MTKESYKDKLTEEQLNVCHLKGTETPFSGKYYKHKEDGSYHCVVCDAPLFSSKTKFESDSGWPSFYDVMSSDAIELERDTSAGLEKMADGRNGQLKNKLNILEN